MKKRLLTSLIILPGSLYLSYGPPIKKFISNKYMQQLKTECNKQGGTKKQKKICLAAGKRNLKKCQHTINVLTLKSGFPKCLQKQQMFLQNCFQEKSLKTCLKS